MNRICLAITALILLTPCVLHADDPRSPTSDGSQEGNVQPPGSGVPDVSPLVHEAIIKAPVGEVWNVFATAEGFKKLGVAQCEMDFRVGGLIRSHYNPKGVIGDEGTIVNQIIAYEPERMMAFRIQSPPKGFPFPDAWKSTWSVATFTDLGDGRTHLRLAGMGYTPDKQSQEMRAFFKSGNAWTMTKLQSMFDSSTKVESGAGAHAPNPLAPLDKQSVVELSVKDTWARISTSAGWQAFLGVSARIELRPGGAFEIEFDDQAEAGKRGSEGCKVLSLVPERMLSFTWNAPPKFEFARGHHTWVVIELEPVSAQRTRVRLFHLGFAELAGAHAEHAAEFEQTRAYFDRAWGMVLERLGTKGG